MQEEGGSPAAGCRARLPAAQRYRPLHSEANARNDLLELQLQTAHHSLDSYQAQLLTKKTEQAEPEQKRTEDLEREVEELKRQALGKEQELAEAMALNYELTIEYDRAINAICNLETELTQYRKDNQDLRRANNQLREEGRHRDMQAKYGMTRASPHSQYLTPDSPASSHSHSRHQQPITIHS